MEEVKIRKAELDDIKKGLLEVFIEGYKYHQNGRPDIFTIQSDEELEQDLMRIFESDSMIVLLNDDRVIGYLSYKIKEKKGNKLMDIDQLVIKEGIRGKGFGKMLIEEAKKIANDNDCVRIVFNCWTFNENALNVYDHLGFKRQRIMYEMSLK